jgi:hypothetical protein
VRAETGAKSGLRRVNPVGYVADGRRYLIWASNYGAPRNPAWWIARPPAASPSSRPFPWRADVRALFVRWGPRPPSVESGGGVPWLLRAVPLRALHPQQPKHGARSRPGCA